MSNNEPKHILAVEENTEGHDFFVGDIHGEISLLKNLVSKLRPQNRLFLLGDLTDRGEDSRAVLEFIRKHNKDNNKPPIFAIRGNHEDLLLQYIHSRLHPELYTEEERQNLVNKYIRNGGEWALGLSNTELCEIQQQIEALPYVIVGKGSNPFILAHADFNLTDEDLAQRIASGNLTLTAEERHYITWARRSGPENQFLPISNPRTWNSVPVYVGHSVLDGLRIETNHINLDFGSCFNGHLGIVNHSTRRCAAHTTALSLDDRVKEILRDINQHLQSQSRPLTSTSELKDNLKNQTKIKKPVSFNDKLRPWINGMLRLQIFPDELISKFRGMVFGAAEYSREKASRLDDRYVDVFLKSETDRILEAISEHQQVLQDIHDLKINIDDSNNYDCIPDEHCEEYYQGALGVLTAVFYAAAPLFESPDFDSRGNLHHCFNLSGLLDAMNIYLEDPYYAENFERLDKSRMFLTNPELAVEPIFQDLMKSIDRVIDFNKVLVKASMMVSDENNKPAEEKENAASDKVAAEKSPQELSIFRIRQALEEDDVPMNDGASLKKSG